MECPAGRSSINKYFPVCMKQILFIKSNKANIGNTNIWLLSVDSPVEMDKGV